VVSELPTKVTHLCDWAEFTEPVDRIVVIEALEHFGFHRYDDFFKFA
jgi:methoxy mycolic acid synthase MmaA3